MTDHEAFLNAWAVCPSQDNSGYVPDKDGFKAGWFMALEWERSKAAKERLGPAGYTVIEEARWLRKELDQQLRLNGIGSEREARLMARVGELTKERDAARDAIADRGKTAREALESVAPQLERMGIL